MKCGPGEVKPYDQLVAQFCYQHYIQLWKTSLKDSFSEMYLEEGNFLLCNYRSLG